MKKSIKMLMLVAAFLCLCETQKVSAAKVNKDFVIVIDPGHGGSDNGAKATYNGKLVLEKDINLTIAKALRKELNTYKNVRVYMTRYADQTVDLGKRVKYAEKKNADLIVSIHNNAKGSAMKVDNGACVIVSNGRYRKDIANASAGAANYILKELRGTGVQNNGLLKRDYPSKNVKYANGKVADYYRIVRDSVKAGIPGMIVEHAFLDNASDYELVLSSNEKLNALGVADATGIAKYFGFKKKDGRASYKAKGQKVKYLSQNWMMKGNNKYYVYNNGTYAKGWKKIDKKWYKFTGSGKFVRKK